MSSTEADHPQLQELANVQEHSDSTLRIVAHVDRLAETRCLRVVVDTEIYDLSGLGEKVPHLQELNISRSTLSSLRNLGTALKNLQVLSIGRCNLSCLDGIGTLSGLCELYAAFNNISDLEPLQDLSELELLDLEGNCITDASTVEWLSLCSPLSSLSLCCNPLAQYDGYLRKVIELLPNLQVLDDKEVWKIISKDDMPNEGSTAHTIEETELAVDGIKHARVGIDAGEFWEQSMVNMAAAVVPLGASWPSSGAGLCPASTAAWLHALKALSPVEMDSRTNHSSGLLSISGQSTASSSLGVAIGSKGCPTTPSRAGTAGAPIAVATSRPGTCSAIIRPATASRPGTAGSFCPAMDASKADTSVPPGLYWRKNRIIDQSALNTGQAAPVVYYVNGRQMYKAMRHSSSGAHPACPPQLLQAPGLLGHEDASSDLTYGMEATLSGNVAKGLRKRRAHEGSQHTEAFLANILSSAGAGISSSETEELSNCDILEHLCNWKMVTSEKFQAEMYQPANAMQWQTQYSVQYNSGDVLGSSLIRHSEAQEQPEVLQVTVRAESFLLSRSSSALQIDTDSTSLVDNTNYQRSSRHVLRKVMSDAHALGGMHSTQQHNAIRLSKQRSTSACQGVSGTVDRKTSHIEPKQRSASAHDIHTLSPPHGSTGNCLHEGHPWSHNHSKLPTSDCDELDNAATKTGKRNSWIFKGSQTSSSTMSATGYDLTDTDYDRPTSGSSRRSASARRVIVISVAGELDLGKVNPTPVVHIDSDYDMDV